jgi:hypothetical protein
MCICPGGGVAYLADSGEAVAPDVVEEDGGFDVAEAVFGDFAVAAFGEHRVDITASDTLRFGGFDAESFAIEIEVETAGCAFAATDVVESELFGEVAVGFSLETVAEPILAGNGDVEESGSEVDERDVEAASVEGDDRLVVFGDVPEGSEQFGFIDARNKFDGAGFAGVLFKVGRSEKDLAAGGFGVEHGDADDLGGERPEAALLGNLGAASGASGFVGDAFAFAEEVFLLGFVEAVEWESGGFDVENKFGHCDERRFNRKERQEKEKRDSFDREETNRHQCDSWLASTQRQVLYKMGAIGGRSRFGDQLQILNETTYRKRQLRRVDDACKCDAFPLAASCFCQKINILRE